MTYRKFGLVVLVLAVGVAGCAGSGRLRYDTPQEAFGKGKVYYEQEKYERAIEYFQGVFDFGRTHQWAADAQLYLARAYRATKQHILAASEYNRFVEIYRADPRVPIAEFERAMTFYERSPQYELDQTATEQGIRAFNLFVERFPDHELVPEAEAYIAEMREKLAHKEYYAAELYERRELYKASAIQYETVFDKYPDTRWADEALLGAMRAYIAYSDQSVEARRPARLQKAVDNYRRLLQLFPDSPLLKDAEALYAQADDRLSALASGS